MQIWGTGQGSSDVHNTGRGGEVERFKPKLERGLSALPPKEGRVEWERVGPVQLEPAQPALHLQSLLRNCPALGAPEGRWAYLVRPQAPAPLLILAPISTHLIKSQLWILLPLSLTVLPPSPQCRDWGPPLCLQVPQEQSLLGVVCALGRDRSGT